MYFKLLKTYFIINHILTDSTDAIGIHRCITMVAIIDVVRARQALPDSLSTPNASLMNS